ncbi:hypothetical protein HZC30_03395 [Candidatus Woesearchaeota archaeon]|nr:hypothetical protein [Candidatus Woesearchaeota archaeon]
MTSKTLDRKILQQGVKLSLIKYQLTNEEAEALYRPMGSSELVLELQGEINNGSTPPRASWYLDENYYRRLFESINHELQKKTKLNGGIQK